MVSCSNNTIGDKHERIREVQMFCTLVSSPRALKGTGYGMPKGRKLKLKVPLSNWKSMR